jgi:tRNA threonylcarbamoyladenosine biosynthesis protein TsaE
VKTLRLRSHSTEDTRAIGRRLGHLLQPGDTLLLTGELGSGKTCLTQGIGEGMGIADAIKSSSFVLMNEYPGDIPLFHADLYRLNDPGEVADLSLEEYAAPGVLVVEWPERAWDELPEEHLLIRMTYEGEQERALEFEAHGARYEALLDMLKEGERG